MKRIRNIALIVAISVIGTIFLVRTINGMVFNTSIPKKYDDVFWAGKWTSSEHLTVSGRLMANLPHDLPINTFTKVDVLAYYNIWTLYNMGGMKEFKLIAFIGGENATGGKTTTTEFQDMANGMKFSAKTSGESGEEIEYTGVVNENRSLIVGGYKSRNPDDIGLFELYRR